MKFRIEKNWLLLSPITLAYLLHGAKTGITLFPVFLLTGVLFLVAPHFYQARPIPKILLWPFALFLLWCWMPLIGGAPIDLHLYNFSRTFFYVLTGILIFQFADEKTIGCLEWLLLSIGCIEAGLILKGTVNNIYLQTGGYLQNSLHSGLFLPTACAVAVIRIQNNHRRDLRTAGLLVALLAMAMSIWFIRSRAGIISLVAILVYLSPKKLIWIVAMLAVFSGTWFVTKKDLFFRILEIDSFGLRSTMSRFCIWSTTIDVIRARPLMGWGLGNFETAYRRFQHPSAELLRYGKSTMFAHNGFLQGTAETGLPGIFFLLWGLVGVIRNALPFLFKERGLFSVVIVFFLTSLTNYSLLLPFNGLVFTTAMALLAIRAASSNKTWPLVELTRLRILPTFAISLLTIFLASTGISEVLEIRGRLDEAVRACPIRSEVWYELALQNLLRSKNALPFLDRALILNQQNSFYWQRKALVLVNYQQSEESKIDQCFKQAQMLAPFHAPFYIQEGFYRLRKSQTESARILFEKAANLEPLAPLPHYGLALTLAQKGDRLAMGVQLDLVRSLKSQQRKLEGDPVYGGPYREMFSSEYARFLFGIDESRLNPPSPASSS